MIIIPACHVAVLTQTDRIPGGQSGNVRWKQVLPIDGNPHLKQGTNQNRVRCLATRTVNGSGHNCKIVGLDAIRASQTLVALDTYYTHTLLSFVIRWIRDNPRTLPVCWDGNGIRDRVSVTQQGGVLVDCYLRRVVVTCTNAI